MTHEEYKKRQRDLVERYSKVIEAHEIVGCYCEAENARERLYHDLETLEMEYKGE